MRLIFAGTPEIAVPTLAALEGAGHEIAAVMTQPDAPGKRGRTLHPSPVKAYALDRSGLRMTVLGRSRAVDIRGCSAD